MALKVTYKGTDLIDETADCTKVMKTQGKYLEDDVTIDYQAGGAPVEEKAVNFYDYDGTLLYSYTAQEAQALTELPEAPTHDGLTFLRWNYDLADVKAYLTLHGWVDVGASFQSADGHTTIFILVDDDTKKSVKIYLAVKGSLAVDWGDGSTSLMEGTGDNVSAAHEYSDTGEYAIKLIQNSGTIQGVYQNYPLLYYGQTDGFYSSNELAYAYMRNITKIWAGTENFDTYGWCGAWGYLYNCTEIATGSADWIRYSERNIWRQTKKLKGFVIPYGVTNCRIVVNQDTNYQTGIVVSVPTTVTNAEYDGLRSLKNAFVCEGIQDLPATEFFNCSSLEKAYLPSTLKTFVSGGSDGCFRNCSSIKEITIPSGVTSIGDNAFRGCSSLTSVTIPSGVTSIGDNAFAGCSSLYFLDLSGYDDDQNIPTLSNTNALQSTPSAQKIWVKNQTMLDAFSAATNWSTYAWRFAIKA